MPFQLLRLAYDEGIVVEYWDFKPPLEAVYIRETGTPPVIGLSRSLLSNRREFRCKLAEELGHHYTTIGSCIPEIHFHYSDRLNISRAEYRAMKWAALYLMPEDKLWSAFRRGIIEVWELAECFDVTEDMVNFRLRLLSAKVRYA